jgi:hypothetical protein
VRSRLFIGKINWRIKLIRNERDKYERIIHLLREIEFARSQLQPHDTGHINTAISWMEKRVSALTEELRNNDAHRNI